MKIQLAQLHVESVAHELMYQLHTYIHTYMLEQALCREEHVPASPFL
jgi:hypothetical protein